LLVVGSASGSAAEANPSKDDGQAQRSRKNSRTGAAARLLGIGEARRLSARNAYNYLAKQVNLLAREMDPLSLVQLIAISVIFALFLVLPLWYVMASAFVQEGVPSLFWFNLLFSQRRYFPFTLVGGYASSSSASFLHAHPIGFEFLVTGQFVQISGDTMIISGVDMGVIMNSIYSGLVTTAFSTIIGVALAFIMARYDFRGKTVLRTLLLVPLLSIPFVGAIGIKRLTSLEGSLNNLFYATLHIWPYRMVLTGLAAVIFIQTLHFFSLTYLSSYSAFLNIDPTLEESGENLGAKGFTLFRKVTLPLALPGIEAGAILTFIMSIEDLGTLLVYQGSLQVKKTLTYDIFTHVFAPDGTVQPIATAEGFVLLFIAAVGFLLIRRYMSLRHYEMLSKGGTWNPRLTQAKWFHYAIFYGFMVTLLAVAFLPHIGVFLLAFAGAGSWGTTDIIPTRFSLENFAVVFTDPNIFGSIRNSLVYCTTATLIIVLLGTSAAYLVARKKFPGRSVLDMLVTLPIALPGIVIAIGYLMFFTQVWPFNLVLSPVDVWAPIAGIVLGPPVVLLTMSYTVRKIPFTVRSAYAGLQQTHVELEEAATNLGADRLRTFVKIVIPLIGVSVLAGAMMSFVYSMSEVSTSIVLGGINSDFAPITWEMNALLYGLGMGQSQAAVMGVLLMVVQIIVMATTNIVLKRRTSALVGL
jgi:iron(III) transport system permease protein